tara:strand:- start:188 stop:469 length:282 start_codon:yes stop_codon:yes gene_type:complete
MFFSFSLSIFISKKFSAKFLRINFETLQSIYSILIYETQHKVFGLGPLLYKIKNLFMENFKTRIGSGTSMAARRLSVYPGAQPMVDAFTAYNY